MPRRRAAMRLLAPLLCSSNMVTAAAAEAGASVVAYLPEWRYEGANWETIAEHTTHLLLFSVEPLASGGIGARDRIPRAELMREARAATRRHGTQLLLCFGGNGRSAGFSAMVRRKKRRAKFLAELAELIREHSLDGVDYNWEYPGYSFGSGYHADKEVAADYSGLAALVRETKEMLAGIARDDRSRFPPGGAVTLAYYPDGRQEKLLLAEGLGESADLLHMMSYDQGGAQHSSIAFGKKAVDQGAATLPAARLTMGVPFYGRHSRTGDWTTYEDLVQRHDPLDHAADSVPAPGTDGRDGATIGFNSVDTIELKTRYALEQGTAGVMIWEVGQDCRLVPVTHGKDTHVRTCPADDASLLLAITRAITAAGRQRLRARWWRGAAEGGGGEL